MKKGGKKGKKERKQECALRIGSSIKPTLNLLLFSDSLLAAAVSSASFCNRACWAASSAVRLPFCLCLSTAFPAPAVHVSDALVLSVFHVSRSNFFLFVAWLDLFWFDVYRGIKIWSVVRVFW